MKHTCDGCDAVVDSDLDPGCLSDFGDSVLCESCRERAYDRQQERLMEDGPGPSLLDQQREAYKIKRGLR